MNRILIADHYQVIRLGLVTLIGQSLGEAHIEIAKDADEVKMQLTNNVFDMLVLEIDIPGSNYATIIDEILTHQKDIRILVFTRDENKWVRMLHLIPKLYGYLSKSAPMHKISAALATIAIGGKYYPEMCQKYLIHLNSGG